MRKADLATEIYEKVGVSKKEAADLVELVLDTIKSVLQKGESFKIAGFGNFIVRSKGPRKGRNPRTGEEIGINPRRVVTFRPSQIFKKYVNKPPAVAVIATGTSASDSGQKTAGGEKRSSKIAER